MFTTDFRLDQEILLLTINVWDCIDNVYMLLYSLLWISAIKTSHQKIHTINIISSHQRMSCLNPLQDVREMK